MSLPLVPLPVLQHWDCHVTGSCCKEYRVPVTDDERQRIEAQGWDVEKDLDGLPSFVQSGAPWARKHHLNHRADGSCVFLSPEGRCRIHERFGYEAKPLPCRLFPYVLVPQGDRWGVSVRYACPSAAADKGRPIPDQEQELRDFADLLARREGLALDANGQMIEPPPLHGTQTVAWPDLRRFTACLVRLLRSSPEPFEKRMRNCLTLSALCRQAHYDHVQGERLDEMLRLLEQTAVAETPRDPALLPAPSWVGRILFRQALALYTRKDHGPSSGLARQGRLALLTAAMRFARGTGAVPRMHNWLPERSFEQIEATAFVITPAAERVLERYYLVKVGSMQFCGPTSFGMSFWEGFEHLALTLPVLLWVARAFHPLPAEEGVIKSLSIVDDHFGFNRVLGSVRQRFSFHLLARRGEIARLIAHYARSN